MKIFLKYSVKTTRIKRWIGMLLLAFVAFMPTDAFSQLIHNNHPALWPSIGVRKSFGDHWRIKLEHSTRLDFMPFRLGETFLQAGGEYRISPTISVGLNYRFGLNYDVEDQFIPEHRISAEAEFETAFKRLSLIFHPSVQATFGRENKMDNRNPLWCFRPEGVIKYNIAKTSIEPYASLEIFLGSRKEQAFSVYKYRVALGLGGRLTKSLKMSGFLMQQGGFLTTDVNASSVLGLEWTYKLGK